jgi:hypothetical protein
MAANWPTPDSAQPRHAAAIVTRRRLDSIGFKVILKAMDWSTMLAVRAWLPGGYQFSRTARRLLHRKTQTSSQVRSGVKERRERSPDQAIFLGLLLHNVGYVGAALNGAVARKTSFWSHAFVDLPEHSLLSG